ncbi:hypothetical protein PhCBS80983_g05710 [Powellomyces hirtus]|uniref:Uncharacterized protein n=1 Tax=Powellomyces hirtus TaxID=109895 RepID=A0A507DSV8_9FUNG|nr:hypothetical protein PhCBS80983_g05710 [Powellomyces hirtus]
MADHNDIQHHQDDNDHHAFMSEPIQYMPPATPLRKSKSLDKDGQRRAMKDAAGTTDSGLATPVDNNMDHRLDHTDTEQPEFIPGVTNASRAQNLNQFEIQKREEARQKALEADEAKKRHEAEMFEKARVLRQKLEAEERLRKENEERARKEEDAARQQVLAKQKAKMDEFEQQKRDAARRAEEARIQALKAKEQEAFRKLELAKQKTLQEEKARREEAERKTNEEHLARAEKLRKQEEAMARFEEERRVKQMSESDRRAYLARKEAEAAAIRQRQDEERQRLAAIEQQQAEEARAQEEARRKAEAERLEAERLANLPPLDAPQPQQQQQHVEQEDEDPVDEEARLATQRSREALLAKVADRAKLESMRVQAEAEANNRAAEQTAAESQARFQREMEAAQQEGITIAPKAPSPRKNVTPETMEERTIRERQEEQLAEEEAARALQNALERKKTVKDMANLDADAWRADLLDLMAAEEAKSRADQANREPFVLSKDAEIASTLSVPNRLSTSRPSMARQSMSVERAAAFQQSQTRKQEKRGGCGCIVM